MWSQSRIYAAKINARHVTEYAWKTLNRLVREIGIA